MKDKTVKLPPAVRKRTPSGQRKKVEQRARRLGEAARGGSDADAARTEQNPFVGRRALHVGEILYCRDREVAEVTDLLIADRIVLLYAPAQAGKTSLLAAGVVPRLEREGFRVLPTIRVGRYPTSPTDGSSVNRYLLSTLVSLEEGLSGDGRHRLEELGTMSLRDYLRPVLEVERSQPDDHSSDLVLIFDQFEEILTLDPTDRETKAEFFGQLGAALRDRRLWALFSMREQHVPELDPYLPLTPTHFRTRYRLDFLSLDAAREAIQQPAAAVGINVSDEAARRLIDYLRWVRVPRPGGTDEKLAPYVEPAQLQILCRTLFRDLPPNATDLDGKRSLSDVRPRRRASGPRREALPCDVLNNPVSVSVTGSMQRGARERTS